MKTPATLRTLASTDAAALLHFELHNRDWFEYHVEARAADFYTLDGVQAHIAELLAQLERGQAHPLLIVSVQGKILGRANLKAMDAERGGGELGYRIAQAHAGQGLASLAVRELMRLAHQRWGLHHLEAYVAVDNPASARVLLKNGFERAECHPGMARVQGRQIDCHRYECVLGDPEGQATVLGGSGSF
jgi:ribosomal-protein-alanine N-acetyltransferase